MPNNKIGKEEIRNSIKSVGLNPDDKKHVGKFSLGMMQRLGLAQAIMEDPDLLILDEPMNGLDKDGVKDMRSICLILNQKAKRSLSRRTPPRTSMCCAIPFARWIKGSWRKYVDFVAIPLLRRCKDHRIYFEFY